MEGEVSGEGDPAKVREEEVSSSAVHRVEGTGSGCNAAQQSYHVYQSLHTQMECIVIVLPLNQNTTALERKL